MLTYCKVYSKSWKTTDMGSVKKFKVGQKEKSRVVLSNMVVLGHMQLI